MWEAIITATSRDVHLEDTWRSLLLNVIETRNVELVFQPICDKARSRNIYEESFARIRQADGEAVAAGLFFPMSSRVGLAVALDRIILSQAFDAALQRPGEACIAINVARQSIEDETSVDWVDAQLQYLTKLGACLAFELAE